MWIKWNPNPTQNTTRDCAIRAVSAALDISWEKSFVLLAENAFLMGETLDSDLVWSSVLRQHGFTKHLTPDCDGCYTVQEFSEYYPDGIYVLKADGHVVTLVDGDYYDTWDSGREIPIYYFTREAQ